MRYRQKLAQDHAFPLSVRVVAALVTMAAATVAHAGTEWLVPACDARLALTVKGDMYAREKAEFQLVLNFNELLGADRTLAALSIQLCEAELGKPAKAVVAGKRVKLQLAQDTAIQYSSGNPILRLRWSSPALRPFAEKRYHLYFLTVKPGARRAWRPLWTTFSAEEPSLVLSTSFEKSHPKRPKDPLEIRPWGRALKGDTSEIAWTDEQARTGKRSLKISRTLAADAVPNTNKYFWYMTPPTLEVREGGIYQFGVWVKMTKCPGRHHASVTLNYCDEKKLRIPGRRQGYLGVRGPMRVCDWSYVHGSLAAPQGARYVIVNMNLGTQGEIFFDDLTIRAVPGSLLPYPEVAVGQLQERDDILRKATEAAPPRLPSVGQAGRKKLVCGVAKQPPELDGVLDDPCWAEAGRVDDLMVHLRPAEIDAPRSTRILACADTEALYLAFDCEEPQADQIIATGVGRDGNIWRDDTVEMFLDTNRDGKSFYQIAFNAKGALFDQDIGVPGLPGESWNGPITLATKIWKDRWTAEVRIAFVGLRLAEAAGRTWTGNFARTSMRGGDRTLYTWVKIKRNFGEPAIFGEIILPFDPTANAITAQPLLSEQVFFGDGDFPVAVRNNRAAPTRVRVLLLSVGEKGTTRKLGESKASLPPTSETDVQVRCAFPEVKTHRLRLEVYEEPGGKLLYVTSSSYAVLPPLELLADSTLSYLGEGEFVGRWRLGLHQARWKESKILLSVKSGAAPRLTRSLIPEKSADWFLFDVSKLPKGDYALMATLRLRNKTVAERQVRFARIRGPFDR